MKAKIALGIVACLLAGQLGSPHAYALDSYKSLPPNMCDISAETSQDKCSTQNQIKTSGAVIVNSPDAPIVASRNAAHATSEVPIDAYGFCRYVINNANYPVFIPYRTSGEWLAFINSRLDNIKVVNCSRGGSVQIPPNFGLDPRANQCASNPPPQSVIAPYKPYPPAAALRVNAPEPFSCRSADGTAFTETAVAQLAGIDSAIGESNAGIAGWVKSDVLYTYDGVCGNISGSGGTEPPSGNSLCHVGVASSVTTSTYNDSPAWAWTCSGGNGGGNAASCLMLQDVDGRCGDTKGMQALLPNVDKELLCASGTPSAVQNATSLAGQPMWTWQCAPASPNGETATCNVLHGSVALTLTPKECTGRALLPVDISILVDASGSMQTLVDAARNSFQKLLWYVSSSPNVHYNIAMAGGSGPYAYKPNPANANLASSCHYGFLNSLGDHNVPIITEMLNDTVAVGNTPLALTLSQAALTLNNPSHKRALVLLSDGIETCQNYGAAENIVPTIIELQSQGYHVYGVMFIRNGKTINSDKKALANFDSMDAYNVVSEKNMLIGQDRLTPALATILNEAQMTTCSVKARIYSSGKNAKYVGELDSDSTLFILPGKYTVVYSLCGQVDMSVFTATSNTNLTTMLDCQ
ncbi:MAG: vWA domain-containing protein [Bdellovibrionales bacterium]